MSDHPPAYQEAVKPPAGAYQPQQGYGAVPQGGYPSAPHGGYGPPHQGGYGPPPQGGYGPPPPGAYNQGGQPPAGAVPSYQYNVTVQPPTAQRVVVVGGCPACRVGVLEDDFTCLGVLCAILFFPIGILCCLAMRQRRCAHCAAVFG
ncbi:membrane protein BRI3-like [Littorina saxatilis]|uniref:Membrane protein BRI3 n=1 Tax=Littorina saxatilis TaxID=31220 RepID=A0AAN9BVM1_9CAEN